MDHETRNMLIIAALMLAITFLITFMICNALNCSIFIIYVFVFAFLFVSFFFVFYCKKISDLLDYILKKPQ